MGPPPRHRQRAALLALSNVAICTAQAFADEPLPASVTYAASARRAVPVHGERCTRRGELCGRSAGGARQSRRHLSPVPIAERPLLAPLAHQLLRPAPYAPPNLAAERGVPAANAEHDPEVRTTCRRSIRWRSSPCTALRCTRHPHCRTDQ